MSSEAEYFDLDREIFDLFRHDASRREHVRISLPESDSVTDPVVEVAPDADDERRISRIFEKARFELLVRDSVEFLFKTMGTGTSELTGAMPKKMPRLRIRKMRREIQPTKILLIPKTKSSSKTTRP